MKELRFLTVQNILLVIAMLTEVLTWIILAVNRDSSTKNLSVGIFEITSIGTVNIVIVDQNTLTAQEIEIQLEKFDVGAIYKPIALHNTHRLIKAPHKAGQSLQ
jgi:hypothetical protein